MTADLGQRRMPRRIEVMDDVTAEIMRRKTPAEKLRMLDELWLFAANLVRSGLRADHPEWTRERLEREAARRMARVPE